MVDYLMLWDVFILCFYVYCTDRLKDMGKMNSFGQGTSISFPWHNQQEKRTREFFHVGSDSKFLNLCSGWAVYCNHARFSRIHKIALTWLIFSYFWTCFMGACFVVAMKLKKRDWTKTNYVGYSFFFLCYLQTMTHHSLRVAFDSFELTVIFFFLFFCSVYLMLYRYIGLYLHKDKM